MAQLDNQGEELVPFAFEEKTTGKSPRNRKRISSSAWSMKYESVDYTESRTTTHDAGCAVNIRRPICDR